MEDLRTQRSDRGYRSGVKQRLTEVRQRLNTGRRESGEIEVRYRIEVR